MTQISEKHLKLIREAVERDYTPDRQFVIQTGRGGIARIHHALRVEGHVSIVKSFTEQKKITETEAQSLTSMLRSPDHENTYLAEQLIAIKLKINE